MQRRETRSMSKMRKDFEGKVITRGRKRKLDEKGITDVLSSGNNPEDPVFKKRAKAAQMQERRERSAEIDAQRIAAAGSSSKQSGNSGKEVTPQSVIAQDQVEQEEIVQSSTGGSQIGPSSQDVPSRKPPNPAKPRVPSLKLNLGGPSVLGAEMSNVDVPSQLPNPAKPRVPSLKLNLGGPSVPDAGTSSVPGLSQEKQQVPELVETKDVTPEIELPKNLDPENVKAFYKEKVQKYIENQKEFQYISDISIDLEKYANNKGFAIPPELKRFRDDFENFSKSVQLVQEALNSDGTNIEALPSMYREIVENQRKLDSSREEYRTGELVDHMDMNWVDGPSKLAVGGYIREHKALRALPGIT